jgi:hypothetical protein
VESTESVGASVETVDVTSGPVVAVVADGEESSSLPQAATTRPAAANRARGVRREITAEKYTDRRNRKKPSKQESSGESMRPVDSLVGVRPSDRYGGAWLRGSARVAVVMFGGLAVILVVAFVVGR